MPATADKLANEAAIYSTEKAVLSVDEVKTTIFQLCMDIRNDEYAFVETVRQYKKFYSSIYGITSYLSLSEPYSTISFWLLPGQCQIEAHLKSTGSHRTGMCKSWRVGETISLFEYARSTFLRDNTEYELRVQPTGGNQCHFTNPYTNIPVTCGVFRKNLLRRTS